MKKFLFMCMFVFILLPPVIYSIVDAILFIDAVCKIVFNSL